MTDHLPPDTVLRQRVIDALRGVGVAAGIASRIPYGALADAVLTVGSFDVVLTDGLHIHRCAPCQHDGPAAHRPDGDYCRRCGAACRTVFAGDTTTGPGRVLKAAA